MRIYDSNLLIYSFLPEYRFFQADLLKTDAFVSTITKLEVLGFQSISPTEKAYFEKLFSVINILPIDDVIVDKAIDLRQKRKMSVGDALIAATAEVHHADIYTHNVSDFNWISGLKVVDPLSP